MGKTHSDNGTGIPFRTQGDLLRSKKKIRTATAIPSQLLDQLKEGSHEAYEEIYTHYRRPIFLFLKVLTGSSAAAEDITQDVFAGVWEKRAQANSVRDIKSYLYAIAKNSAINYFRKKCAEDNFYRYAETMDYKDIASDEKFMAEEMELLVKLAVARMPAMRRKIFEMSFFQRKSNEQIALELNISKGLVATHISQARKEINDILTMLLLMVFSNNM